MPETNNLRATEVFDGGVDFEDVDKQCTSDGDMVQVTYKMMLLELKNPQTLPSEQQNIVGILQKFILMEQTLTPMREVYLSKICRFSGSGDVTVYSSDGIVVIGGTYTDNEETTPLKEGDVATTTNKSPTNPATYKTTEKQLFAKMHLSASETDYWIAGRKGKPI